MAVNHISEVISHLRRAVLLRDGAGLTDGQLLEDYIRRHEEAALAALVHRHGPMVWGVCRRVLRNYHDAEDAFQATFLVLVRKAASVVPREMVANWLYGVAHQTALKARATTAKRRVRERQVTQMPEPAVTEQDLWHDLQPLLDQELNRLPDIYRVAIVLCDLEGNTRKEAARQLGVPEGTLAARLARGRGMLARRLAGHGLGVSGGALAAVLSQNVASAGVPTSIVSSTIRAASLFAAGQAAATGAISAKVAALTEGVLKAMLVTKLKIATAVVLGAILACSGFGLLGKTLTAAEQTEPRQEVSKETKADAPKWDAAKDAEKQKEKEAAELNGKWHGVAAEVAGEALPEEVAKTNVWNIADGKITRKLPDAKKGEDARDEEVVPFMIDPTKKPAHLDLEVEIAGIKGVMKGIYHLDGDELTVCMHGADGGRPSEFSSNDEKGGNMLLKFKRQKEDDKKLNKEKKEQKEGQKKPLKKAEQAIVADFKQLNAKEATITIATYTNGAPGNTENELAEVGDLELTRSLAKGVKVFVVEVNDSKDRDLKDKVRKEIKLEYLAKLKPNKMWVYHNEEADGFMGGIVTEIIVFVAQEKEAAKQEKK